MNFQTHQKVFSNERMQKYLDFYSGNQEKAVVHYKANLLLSETFYTVLSILEVALRNSMNRELTKHFGTQDWHLHISHTPGLKDINNEISLAQRHIIKRGEAVSGPKVVSELTLGFWIRILNTEYERILWKSLRRAFPFLPKKERQRHRVSVPLNKIRNFRNRVYHNEPISWSFTALQGIHAEIIEVLGWLNHELPGYANSLSGFYIVLRQVKDELGIA